MPRIRTRLLRAAAAISALLALSPAFAVRTQTDHNSPTPNSDVLACSVLEVHPNTQSGATIAIIHQQNKTD